jgi:hypothetical protein
MRFWEIGEMESARSNPLHSLSLSLFTTRRVSLSLSLSLFSLPAPSFLTSVYSRLTLAPRPAPDTPDLASMMIPVASIRPASTRGTRGSWAAVG